MRHEIASQLPPPELDELAVELDDAPDVDDDDDDAPDVDEDDAPVLEADEELDET